MKLLIVSRNYQWNCGDGCCSDSKQQIEYYSIDKNGYKSQFHIDQVYSDTPETLDDLLRYLPENSFEKKIVLEANNSDSLEFIYTLDEYEF